MWQGVLWVQEGTSVGVLYLKSRMWGLGVMLHAIAGDLLLPQKQRILPQETTHVL